MLFLLSDASQSDGTYNEPILITGCWNNTLLAELPLYLPDGTSYYYYVALQGGEITGFMEKHDGGILTFYNETGQLIGTTDCYQNRIAPLSIQFPRAD